ncbi:hypothetical protein MWU60_15115 [Yoonia sp. F2084L]|uniref:hypothetical protein n=1 Tax=Yoonia sp. F2084L TaxID=2926419 RepID=UPI001FF1DC01|nr:hypothetical protein [Yoonia sp. F2084L]MCK0096908.1 hypothetical protein [Yoonia sp. F2084L]
MPHDPKERPPLQPAQLIRVLADFKINWVLCGSQVLALHGADLAPNDLDVVPDLAPDNLRRVADCLDDLHATAAYLDGWGGPRGTLEACRAWHPDPATAEHLDWLFVTPFGMLDIVIEHADSYASLMNGATRYYAEDVSYWVCDPRRVLQALEGRKRPKDAKRRAVYRAMRRKFGMPDLPDAGGD